MEGRQRRRGKEKGGVVGKDESEDVRWSVCSAEGLVLGEDEGEALGRIGA